MRMRKVTDEKGAVIGEEPLKILDVAGGTGDISFRMHEKAKSEATAGSKESLSNETI
jgi:ubiquinone/menaquinone biosynthesis C-methylase UbiE